MEARTPFTRVSAQARKIARRYRVPAELLTSVKADPEEVARAVRAAFDRQWFELVSVVGKVKLFGRPASFAIRPLGGRVAVTLQFPTAKVTWFVDAGEFAERPAEEWYRRLTDWVWVEATHVEVRSGKRRRAYWRAERVRFARVEEDVEAFEYLVKRYEQVFGPRMAVFAACTAMLGYSPHKIIGGASNETKALLVARLLPLAAAEPVHYFELSVPGSGKTTIALKLRHFARWAYYNEPPSAATLVGDARTGRSIIAGVNGIWFDEVDKWPAKASKREAVTELIEIMLTGLEQGYWRRGKGGEKAIEVSNEIPAVFTGNPPGEARPRDALERIVGACAGQGAARAFSERISVAVAVETARVSGEIQEAVHGLGVRASALRGMITWLRERYLSLPEPPDAGCPYRGRLRRHFKRVARALAALGGLAEYDQQVFDVARELIEGLTL